MSKLLLLKNGQIDIWPATINTLKSKMPDVSFPKKVTLPFLINEYSLIEPTSTAKPDGYKVTEVLPIQSGSDWVQQWNSRAATQDELDADAANQAESDKINGMDYNGVKVSLTEENQNGISSVLTAIDIAEKYSQTIFPLIFNAVGPEGVSRIIFNDRATYESFGLQFMAARQAFFT